jgi:hypothetical protein
MRTFNNMVRDLDGRIPKLLELSNEWIKNIEYREEHGILPNSQEHVAYIRERLEERLTSFRLELGELYDFMSEKGLRDLEEVGQ